MTAHPVTVVREISHDLVSRLVREVAERYSVRSSAIYGPSKERHITEARQRVCFEARKHGLSFSEIGRCLDLDHSSVMAAVKRENERIEALEHQDAIDAAHFEVTDYGLEIRRAGMRLICIPRSDFIRLIAALTAEIAKEPQA